MVRFRKSLSINLENTSLKIRESSVESNSMERIHTFNIKKSHDFGMSSINTLKQFKEAQNNYSLKHSVSSNSVNSSTNPAK